MGRTQSRGGILRALRAAAGAAAVAACAALSGPAAAADQCIAQAARDALTACPGGATKTRPVKKSGVRLGVAKEAADAKRRGAAAKPTAPVEPPLSARDERRIGVEPRRRVLLGSEIEALERLLASTPRNAPDRPRILRRLAEGYVELESAAGRDRTEASARADQVKRKDAEAAKRHLTEAAKNEKIATAARRSAIKYYNLLRSQYPTWCTSVNAADPAKSTGCGDEVLYYLAYEYEQGGEMDGARKVYLELITKWPQSRYVPRAYLAFGELFFQEAQGDPAKWQLAEQSYLEVAKYPPPDNQVFGYAHYKLGHVYWNQGDLARALSEFKKTIDHGQQHPQIPSAAPLAAAARRDLVPVYALSGEPKRAFDFFRPLSGDAAGSREKTIGLLEDLGRGYLDVGRYAEAVALYQDLLGREPGARRCVYQGYITEATLAVRSGDKDAISGALAKQLETQQAFDKEGHPEAARLACANTTAAQLSETAMAWHLEAVGSDGVRGTNDQKTMRLSASLYDKVVDSFTKEQFARFEFPRIIREDWPTLGRIKYARADLLYYQKDWERCGPAFDAVFAEDPRGPEAEEARYTAALCYQNLYLAAHQDGSDRRGMMSGSLQSASRQGGLDLAPRELSEAQRGMLGAFQRYVCGGEPPADDKEAASRFVEVKYARARTYFEAHRWEEAALAFRDVALHHPGSELGIFAAQLSLESLNVLSRTEAKRPACRDDMSADVPRYIELYCQGDKEKGNAEHCTGLRRVEFDLQRIRAEEMVNDADRKKGPQALRLYEEAAGIYMNLWKHGGEPACQAKQPACARSEELLYNAAKAFQAARLVARAIAARRILLDTRYGLEGTQLARKAVYEIGASYQAIAVYDEAAAWYERFARENPKMEKAPEALQDAVVLRLGLGQEDLALQDAELFTRNHGLTRPAQAAHIAFAVGAHEAQQEDWDQARKRMSSAMRAIDQHAGLDLRIQAHALLGRVLDKLGQASQAAAEHRKARDLWADPKAARKQLEALGGDEAEQARRLGKTLEAVGEAHFYFAEQKRKEVDRIVFPAYTGPGNREDVLRHVQTKVAAWVQKKRAAIEVAEGEYLKIVALEPAPPPRWVVAAGARAGQMWSRFVAEFRAAPIPREWKQNGAVPGVPDLTWEEIRYRYYEELDKASEPQKQRARAAYRKCLDYSVKYQHFDDHARSCEVWLAKNYAAEVHLLDELRGLPSRIGSGLEDRPAPLGLDRLPAREAGR